MGSSLGLSAGPATILIRSAVGIIPTWLVGAMAILWAGLETSCTALPTNEAMQKAFGIRDSNQGGVVSRAEWQKSSLGQFTLLDTNGDGFIQLQECWSNEMLLAFFGEADTEGIGRLTRTQFVNLREIVFDAVDINRDDFMSFLEYELLVLLRRTGWHDANDNGRIEISELDAALGAAFPLLDANHNGALSKTEAPFLSAEDLAAMDPRKTHRITLRQFIDGYRFQLGADSPNRNLVPQASPGSP